MQRLRGKFSYSNVISTLCLVLVLGGGTAYAASELGKESVGTAQLKKEAVTPAKLSKASRATLAGPKGANGATGPQGPKGDQGNRGERGERGEPGTLVETLPTGRTERGTWGLGGTHIAADFFGASTASFPVPLASQPAVHVVSEHGPSTSACPGTSEEPEAAPGNLCVYLSFETAPIDVRPLNHGGGLKFGFLYTIDAAENSDYEDLGTWAVTAG